MSFSSKVKKELAGHISNATHCRIAEIAAIISMCGSVLIDVDEKYSIRVRTETDSTAENISYRCKNCCKKECIFKKCRDIYYYHKRSQSGNESLRGN